MREWAAYGLVGLAAAAAALLWPLPSALDRGIAVSARAGAIVSACLVCAGAASMRRFLPSRKTMLLAGAALAGGGAIAAQVAYSTAVESCVAIYDGKSVIIGRELQSYVRPEPGTTASDLLFDAAGNAERVWTPESIRRCSVRLSWGGFASIPLFAAAACFLLTAGLARKTIGPGTGPRQTAPGLQTPAYDFFLSYRHGEPDRSFAIELLESLENAGLRGAIDERDFEPQEHFLTEMERCIKQSRFLLCVVTKRYMDSDPCIEEAVISKTLDMSERKRRLVPLRFDDVELPVWLHGIVGIDFSGGSTDPMKRLRKLLLGAKGSSDPPTISVGNV
jgi:hypothetical protein